VNLIWTAASEEDRLSIFAYIAADNPRAAFDMEQLFEDRADQLPDFPNLGRIGQVPGTRELTVHPNYRMIYEVMADEVRILNVVHAARNWPGE
jgi:toxin ParE1/3/4